MLIILSMPALADGVLQPGMFLASFLRQVNNASIALTNMNISKTSLILVQFNALNIGCYHVNRKMTNNYECSGLLKAALIYNL